jgi:hypothetical protein
MITSAYEIPHDGYWRVAGQVFQYPLMTVFAGNQTEADKIAGPDADDPLLVNFTAMDSAEASSRLGIWGRPDLLAQITRGD